MSVHLFPHTVPRTTQTGVAGYRAAWLWLSVPIAILVSIISVIGLSAPGLYRDPPAWAIQVVAQDFVDLVLVLPALVVSVILAARGSQRARLVWLGTLSYLIYTFVIYTFAVHHNPLFLVYVAALACSLWALIGGMATTDWREIRAQFAPGTPIKIVSMGLIIQATLFYLLWFGDELPAALGGNMPQSLQDTGLLTNPVHVLDMAVLLPAIVLSGVWLWRNQAIGYGLAASLLVNMVFQGLGIAAIMVFSIRAGLPGSLGIAGVFLALSAANLALLVWYLRGMKNVNR